MIFIIIFHFFCFFRFFFSVFSFRFSVFFIQAKENNSIINLDSDSDDDFDFDMALIISASRARQSTVANTEKSSSVDINQPSTSSASEPSTVVVEVNGVEPTIQSVVEPTISNAQIPVVPNGQNLPIDVVDLLISTDDLLDDVKMLHDGVDKKTERSLESRLLFTRLKGILQNHLQKATTFGNLQNLNTPQFQPNRMTREYYDRMMALIDAHMCKYF